MHWCFSGEHVCHPFSLYMHSSLDKVSFGLCSHVFRLAYSISRFVGIEQLASAYYRSNRRLFPNVAIYLGCKGFVFLCLLSQTAIPGEASLAPTTNCCVYSKDRTAIISIDNSCTVFDVSMFMMSATEALFN